MFSFETPTSCARRVGQNSCACCARRQDSFSFLKSCRRSTSTSLSGRPARSEAKSASRSASLVPCWDCRLITPSLTTTRYGSVRKGVWTRSNPSRCRTRSRMRLRLPLARVPWEADRATAAVAVSKPTPGISAITLQARSFFIQLCRRCSIIAICLSKSSSRVHCSRSVSSSTAGKRSDTRFSIDPEELKHIFRYINADSVEIHRILQIGKRKGNDPPNWVDRSHRLNEPPFGGRRPFHFTPALPGEGGEVTLRPAARRPGWRAIRPSIHG